MRSQKTPYEIQQAESAGVGRRLIIVTLAFAGMMLLSYFITPIVSGSS